MNETALQETITRVALQLGLDEDQVHEKAREVLAKLSKTDDEIPADFGPRLVESLGGPASAGAKMGELQGRMMSMDPEGGVIGGLGAMLGQSRGNEEPHMSLQDSADAMNVSAERIEARAARELSDGPPPGSNEIEEIDETDLPRGERNVIENAPDLNDISEDDIATGLDGADGNQLPGDETEGLARAGDFGNS